MPPKQARSSEPAQATGANPRPKTEAGPSRGLVIAAMGLLGLAVAIAAYFIIKQEFFPTYWTAEELGPVQINASSPAGPIPQGMVWVPGGTFWMGSDSEQFPDAGPVHKVYVDGFWMDRTEVTNAQFARFVEATGYVTLAEHWTDPKKFPGFDARIFGFQPEYLAVLTHGGVLPFPGNVSWTGLGSPRLLKPFSLVFIQPAGASDLVKAKPVNRWQPIAWASWRQPEGPGSDLTGRENHPVVHISYDDALAYARWAGKRLPTEAEWEFASRGGLDRKKFLWGDKLKPDGKPMANIWQGEFPGINTLEDGYAGTAPVGSFPPNGFGLSDMSGNVWEWCADWYQPSYIDILGARNPKGPATGFDPREPGIPKRVQRGGSFLCSDNNCKRYMAGGREAGDPDTSSNHVGFRCVRSLRTSD